MLEKIILINSAGFSYLTMNLGKDLLFLGDNGNGKTTLIRAIHYLFNSDTRKLGIPPDKNSFAQHYFNNEKYENSYIFYVFTDFFILVYKKSGEIIKIFSKQKFDISQILKTKVADDQPYLLTHNQIQQYAKNTNLYKRVKSVSEYRKIIYGNHAKYLDFKISHIKESDIFVGLFNEVFNIDGSIVDSKSIKKAIQSTLNIQGNLANFDYKDYSEKIQEFQFKYNFHKQFEVLKANIDLANKAKRELLTLKVEIDTVKGKINFRIIKEKELLVHYTQELTDISENKTKLIYRRKNKNNVKDKINKKCGDRLIAVGAEIKSIELLKVEFSDSAILSNRNLADKYNDLEQEYNSIHNNYIRLTQKIDSALASLEREVSNLKRQRDKALVNQSNDRLRNKEDGLKQQLDEGISRLDLKYDRLKKSLEDNIDEIKKYQEERIEADIEQEKNTFEKAKDTYQTQKQTISSKKTQDIDIQNQNKFKIEKLQHSITLNNIGLDDDIKIQEKKQQEAIKNNELTYQKEDRKILNAIEECKGFIVSKSGTFKEFLHNEVDGWEEDLYPMMDDRLLNMSITELEPTLRSENNSLFPIKVNTEHLKKIPTISKAEELIKIEMKKQESLKGSYEQETAKSNEVYKDKIEKLTIDIDANEKKIKEIDGNINDIVKNIQAIEDKASAEQQDLQKEFTKDSNNHKDKIKELKDLDHKKKQEIKQIRAKIKKEGTSLSKQKDNLRATHEANIANSKAEATRWLKNEQKLVDVEIKKVESSKGAITEDEQVKLLNNQLSGLAEKKDNSRKAQLFLERYKENKSKIDALQSKKNQLENIKTTKEKLENRITLKIKICSENLEKLDDRRNKIKKEIDKLESIEAKNDDYEFDNSPIESTEYLKDLLKIYDKNMTDHGKNKSIFANNLQKLKNLKNPYSGIDFNFSFDADFYDKNTNLSENIIAKLNDIIEFKETKLEVIKKADNEAFITFIRDKLSGKLSEFNNTQDDFLKKVRQVNSRLSGIDFGVIKNIKLDTQHHENKSIAKLLGGLDETIMGLMSYFAEGEVFYNKHESLEILKSLDECFSEIKAKLNGNAISLIDTIDLTVSFIENGRDVSGKNQIKNESSQGGSILLKIAIVISILELFIKEKNKSFFLIVDEISRLSNINQEKLRKFANDKGFKIIFVTPDTTYAKTDIIKYYRFEKDENGNLEAVELNLIEDIAN